MLMNFPIILVEM